MENITTETETVPTETVPAETVPTETVPAETVPEQPTQPSIMTVEIKDENVALNILVSFLNIAQKRGAFNLEESARIWECVQKFVQTPPAPAPVPVPTEA